MFAKALHDCLRREPALDVEALVSGLDLPCALPELLDHVAVLERRRVASRRRHFLRDSTTVQQRRIGLTGCRLLVRSMADAIASAIAEGFAASPRGEPAPRALTPPPSALNSHFVSASSNS